LDDEIIAVNGLRLQESLEELLVGHTTVSITLIRNYQLRTVELTAQNKRYFKQYTVAQREEATEEEKQAFQKWLNCPW